MRKLVSIIVLVIGVAITAFGLLDVWINLGSSEPGTTPAEFWLYIFTQDPYRWCCPVGLLLVVASVLTLRMKKKSRVKVYDVI